MNAPKVKGVRFRQIPGMVGYAAGDDGSIWTRFMARGRGASGGKVLVLTDTWRKRKTTPMGKRRTHVITITQDGEPKLYYAHRLILLAFVGPCPDGMECCHNDGNPENNRLDNLRWDTPKGNMADRTKHGRTLTGSRSSNAKLTEVQVAAIRREYVPGKVGYTTLARKYGVSKILIRKIVGREIWAHTP